MYASTGKKLLGMMILEILRTHSDEQHRLKQKEIIRLVRNVFEQALMRQAQRLCTLHEGQSLVKEDLRQLTVGDFDVTALQTAPSSHNPVGFSVS